MRRFVAMLAVPVLAMVVGPVPAADAAGAAGCTISGTIRFTPGPKTADRGTWDIAPAVIQCQGMFNIVSSPRYGFGIGEQINGNGQQFSGSGSYNMIPSVEPGCIHELGEGTVDYWIRTNNQDVHMRERNTFLLPGAGLFTTPTLYGSFQILGHEGDCVSGAVTTALFLAEVTMVRSGGLWK